MCGIFGFIGNANAVKHVINGLKHLEYRGYDSAGIAFHTSSGISTIKTPGRVLLLDTKAKDVNSSCAIGHTRWATHGLPTEANAHPHSSDRFSIVHNGIIENYQEIKKDLISEGVIFRSETDSEVIAHLLETLYNGDLINTLNRVCNRLQGAYAIAVLSDDNPDCIIATSKDSPLIIGKGKEGCFVSSDMNALQGLADEVIVLSDNEYSMISNDSIKCFDNESRPIEKKRIDISDLKSRNMNIRYSSHMLSEIHEIPRAISDTISYYDANGLPKGLSNALNSAKRVIIVACGTAHNAGMAGRVMIERLTGIPTSVEYASEFRYSNPVFDKNTLVIAISQSGETADTIAAVRLAQSKGTKVLCITNVQGSTLTRSSAYLM